MSSKRILATVAVVCGVLSVAPAAAPADKPGPFMPFRTADFDLPAGARCPFALSGRVQVDRERIRTTQATHGTPRQQQVVGKLVVRYINMSSGASVDRNLTGNALIDNHPDGSFTITLQSVSASASPRPTRAARRSSSSRAMASRSTSPQTGSGRSTSAPAGSRTSARRWPESHHGCGLRVHGCNTVALPARG